MILERLERVVHERHLKREVGIEADEVRIRRPPERLGERATRPAPIHVEEDDLRAGACEFTPNLGGAVRGPVTP